MNISEWLDKKEAQGTDVSQVVLPEDLANDEAPEETIFLRRFDHAASFAPAAILFPPSRDLDTGIIPEAATKKMAHTQQSRNGGCSPETKTWQ